MDDELLVSKELTDDDIVSACSSSFLEIEEEESCEQTLERVSKRDAEKALETLHKYFKMSNIGNPGIFDQIYTIEKHPKASSTEIQTNITDFFKP